jgi:N-acetylglucosamine kinase-like BadF-type ATPase
MSAVFVAVDGGATKTDVVIGDSAGRILGLVRGSGSSPHSVGVPGALALLDTLVAEAVADAGLPAGTVLDLAAVYIAGADLPVEVDVLMKAIAEAGWAREHQVDNDLFALLRAGTATPDAVAVICGTGINCLGRTANGRVARFPALGEISGDWGGGEHLAKLALWHAARGEDGRGPATALIPAVIGYFGVSTVEDIAAGLHLGDIDRARISGLCPVLFTVAAAGDKVARRVIARQAREIVSLATVAAHRLDLLDREHSVVLGGSVLTARHPLLHNAVINGLRHSLPRATIEIVADPPVAGAALLALDALAAGQVSPAIESALRAGIRTATSTLPPT